MIRESLRGLALTVCLFADAAPVAAGSDPVGSTPEEFAAYVRTELARWGKVIRDNNIRSD